MTACIGIRPAQLPEDFGKKRRRMMGGCGSSVDGNKVLSHLLRPPGSTAAWMRYRSNGEHLLNVVIEARPDYPNLRPTARAPERERGGSSMSRR